MGPKDDPRMTRQFDKHVDMRHNGSGELALEHTFQMHEQKETSKYFCLQRTHDDCAHDWDPLTRHILATIDTFTTATPWAEQQDTMEHMMEDDKDRLIRQLMQELQMTKEHSESYWQHKLQAALDHGPFPVTLHRETLSKHRFITDLSNRNFLIEIKHQKDYRTAVGQVCDYVQYKRREQGDPVWFVYILLFGDLQKRWTVDLWQDRQRFCQANGILLRWLRP